MIFVGLGSNVGNRERFLQQAIHLLAHGSQKLLTNLRLSNVYESDALLPEGALSGWNKPFLNLAVAGETSLTPELFLREIKAIEKKIGRKEGLRWAPREIDIDILAWNESEIHLSGISIPHPGLLERPFALLPFSEVAPSQWRFPGEGINKGKTPDELARKWNLNDGRALPFSTRRLGRKVFYPELVGILNVTPDSFSDGGHFKSCDQAIQRFQQMASQGAQVIDIGAESTRPGATLLSPEEEWARLDPVLSALFDSCKGFSQGPLLSIDTRQPATAERALKKGAHWINDVSAFSHPHLLRLVADYNADLVFMHHLNIPPSKENVLPLNENPIETILSWADAKIANFMQAGIAREKLIFDPGIGFGKTSEQNLHLLREFSRFCELGVRTLVGHSRKSFLGGFTERTYADRDIETLAVSLDLTKRGVDYLRIHNVEWHARALGVQSGL